MRRPAILVVEGDGKYWWGKLVLEGLGEFEVDGIFETERFAEDATRSVARALEWPIAYKRGASSTSSSLFPQ